jgi:hypothetical protein
MINRCKDNFPREIAKSLYQASKIRMDRQSIEQKYRRNIIGKFRDGIDETVMNLRCKGVLQSFKNSRFCRGIQSSWSEWRSPSVCQESEQVVVPAASNYRGKLQLLIAALIGSILTYLYMSIQGSKGREVNFFYYLYLCTKHYDGSMPVFEKESERNTLLLDSTSSADHIPLGGGGWWHYLH